MSAPKYEDHEPLHSLYPALHCTPSSCHSPSSGPATPPPSFTDVRARVEFLLHFVCKCKCRLAFAHFKLVPGNRAGIQVRVAEGRGAWQPSSSTFSCAVPRSRGLILAPRHFWSWVIGMCSAFLYISHSLQETKRDESLRATPSAIECEREREEVRVRKASRPIRFVTCRITWHVWQAKDMNIIKCNNYIFSSSKAMFKLRCRCF